MKKCTVLIVLFGIMLLVNVSIARAEGKFGKAIELIESAITWPERALVTQIEQQGANVFKLTGNVDDFRPRKGGIKVCKAQNKLFIGFYLSKKNIDFYKGQVYEDGERKPIGLEIDVTDDNKIFDLADLQSVTIFSKEGNSFNAGFYLDNPISDLKTVHTIGIANPGNLTPKQWYYAEFQFSKHNEVSQARFQLQVQLVGDVWNLRSNHYDDFSASIKTGLYAWFGSAGYENIPANNFFNIVSPRLIFNRDKFFGWPEGLDTGYDRFLWDMSDPNNDGGQIGDYKPYHCGFGSDPWDNPDGNDGDNDDDDGGGNNNNDGNGGSSGNNTPEDDISIISCKAKIYGETNYQHSVIKTATIDEYFNIDAEAVVKNKSNYDSYDTDIDYRVDHHNNKFDSNDTKLSEDTVDIPAGDTITKHMGRTTVHVSHDGKTITVSKGSHHETFDVINGKATFYIFLDVENRGDKDISSETKHGEHAKVTVLVHKPRDPQYNSIASETLRFYNNVYGAHFFTVNINDRWNLPKKYPDWIYHDPSFIAFKTHYYGTVPLYTCWTKNETHDYAMLAGPNAWQHLSDFAAAAECTETPWVVFYVYPTQKPNTKPVHLMKKQKNYSSSYNYILSNGQQDANHLRDTFGFTFVNQHPLFWAPTSLSVIPAPPQIGKIVSTMRFYNWRHHSHLYSVNADDIVNLPRKWPDWQYHGTSFKAFTKQRPGTVPVYACWSKYGTHKYSRSWSYAKQDCTENPWIAFYEYPGPGPGRKPVRQLWQPQLQVYIYSNGEADANSLVRRHGFQKHGIAWYAPQ